ncbi:PREDICTED: RNA-directed DNA polymerase from mobile element jockey-like, partial [Papilio xuthus]|uniref:RNA-directed DNA polymerase from mobile element jockey-like n=1 Tax=Papilio xuthus TaxID=66420 RepID=A0AAJ6ZKX7_PAPXU
MSGVKKKTQQQRDRAHSLSVWCSAALATSCYALRGCGAASTLLASCRPPPRAASTSINTGQDELTATLLNYSPDIVALNETWLKPGEEAAAPAIPSYKFLHKARQGKKGGGVGFYVRQGITSKVQKHPTSKLEQFWLEVQLQGSSLAVGTAYRPESVGVQDALDALSESINSLARCDLTCVLGDINIDMASPKNPKAQELLHFCHQHNLEQLVKEPTRITQHSGTILDLVLTDNASKCRNVQIIHNYCLSDHALVIVDFDIRKSKFKKEIKYRRPLLHINFDSFNADLNRLPWDSIGDLQDVNQMVKTFNSYMLLLFDIHAPIRKIICGVKPKPWITNMIRFMMRLRDQALQRALKVKKESAKDYYRNLRNLVTASIERERRAYFNSFINNNLKDSATLWRNIKKITQVNSTKTNMIPDHLSDPDKINDHFLNLPPCPGTILDARSMNLIDASEHDELKLKPVSEEEVKNTIYNIKTKAVGHDDLSIDMIKLTLKVTLPIITKMVNKSIETNTFPSSWKKALVKPIQKKSTVVELKDLRPISILPVLSKVLEKVVLVQVLKYLGNNNITPKLQSGFRKAHGTETALLKVTDDLTEASDMGLSSIM